MQDSKTTAPVPIKVRGMTTWYITLFLFVGIITLSLAIWLYGFMQENKIRNLNEEITTKKTEITKASADPQVVIAEIINHNDIKPSIHLQDVVTKFGNAANMSAVRLQGFSISDDTIRTNLISTRSNDATYTDSATTVIGMMKAYDMNKGLDFHLEPIFSLAGNPERRMTDVTFKVVSNAR